MEKKFCSACGEKLVEKVAFCPHCGCKQSYNEGKTIEEPVTVVVDEPVDELHWTEKKKAELRKVIEIKEGEIYYYPTKKVKYVKAEPCYKSMAIFTGMLLGFLGMHNFYLGYYSKALIQLALGLLTMGIVSLPWAIIDIINLVTDKTDKDGYGIPIEKKMV